MQAQRRLPLGQKSAKKFLERYDRQLICALMRHDEQRRERGATVETIVEESGWSPPEKPEIVGIPSTSNQMRTGRNLLECRWDAKETSP